VNVEYPLTTLDLSEFVIGPKTADIKPVYDLFAVSNHYGGYGGGHYTCYSTRGDQWHQFDDSSVSKVSESTVRNNPNAYVLFYRLRK
jgi:ubiquitin C-terminal hydrolase